MSPADAIIILYGEFNEAMKRGAVRIGSATCEAPAEAVLASAIAMFLRKSPGTRRILLGMLAQSTGATHPRQN